jgi:hypothetical protein
MRSGTIRVLRALIPAAVAVGVVCAGTAHPEARQDCEILSEDENHVTFTVRLSGYELKEVTVGGVTYSRIVTGDLTSIAGEGQPDIPAFPVMLAVPEGASVRLESFSRSDETVLEGVRVLPVARLEARGEDAGRFADNIYDEDRSVYGGVAPFPGSSVWVTDRGRLRHQDVARVFVSPFIYEPGRERLIVSSEMTVTVGFQGKPQRAAAPPADDRWEGVYHDVLLNYEQGRHWRARKAPTTLRSEVTNDRLKMLIETTGMHRLEFDNASAVGFPEGIAMDEIFIYRDEFREGTPDTLEVVESAIDIFDNDQDGFFSSGDGIVFYAKDLREQFGYRGNEDMFFDYNVYWLSWGPGEHRRMESRPGWREG